MSPRSAALLFFPLILLAPLQGQQSKLEREIDFVRSLATKLRFISLAQSEVDQMKQRYKDAADFQQVAQLGVEISLIGAKMHPNREEKRTLYHDALQRCTQFLERYSEGPAALAARITLADASLEFGRFLADEIEIARLEAPSKVPDLETQAAEVFRAGVDACERVMKDLEPKVETDQRARIDHNVTWMRKGILLREHARAVQKDRAYLAGRAQEELEELIFSTGEETALGQRAFFEMAQVNEVVSDLDSAVISYRDVIASANTALTNDEVDLPGDIRELMVITLEEAFSRVAATLFTQGKTQDVLDTLTKYRDNLKALGVPLTDLANPKEKPGKEDSQFGHSLYLTYARALAESGKAGDSAKALALVQFLNDEHPNDYVGLRAKVALKEMLAVQASHVSGALLLEVAKGDYLAKEWEHAVIGLRRAIAGMSDAELASLGLEAYYLMGQSFKQQDRMLEATLALQTGLDKYTAAATDEGLAEKAASLIQFTVRQVQSNAEGDKYYEPLANRVADLAAEHGPPSDAAKRSWATGGQKLAEKDYDAAVTAYRRITRDSVYYELAQARIVIAFERKDDYPAARQAIASYREFLETKDANIPDDRNDLKQARQMAAAQVDFEEAYLLYLEGSGQGKAAKDLTKFPEVIQLLSDYASRHGSAGSAMTSRVLFVLARSYIEMGKLDKAAEKYRTLQKEDPHNANIPVLASSLFTAYDDQITAKTQEVDAIANRDDAAALATAKAELEALRRQAIGIGLEYVESSDQPQYSIATNTLFNLQALQDWTRVETFGNKVVAMYGEDPELKAKVDEHVRPVIGDAVLRQRKFRQAYDMLAAAEKANPNDYPLKRLICLALGGWQEIDARGQVVPYVGLGKPAEAYDKYWTEYKTYGLNRNRGVERYSLPWYEYHWELYHFALAAAKVDSQFIQRAKTIYSLAESTDNFAHLDELGARGKDLRSLFDANQPPR